MDVSEEELQPLYTWVDEIPLSRPKRNIARDFSDGVLMAEIVHHYFPKLVELHNYSSAHAIQQKLYNWNTLNTRVFRKLGFQLPRKDVDATCAAQQGAIERALQLVKVQISGYTGQPMGLSPGPVAATPGRSPAPAAGQLLAAAGAASSSPFDTTSLAAKLSAANLQAHGAVSSSALVEKEATIAELRESNEILETKVRKLEQLVKLKDAKITTIMARLQQAGLA